MVSRLSATAPSEDLRLDQRPRLRQHLRQRHRLRQALRLAHPLRLVLGIASTTRMKQDAVLRLAATGAPALVDGARTRHA